MQKKHKFNSFTFCLLAAVNVINLIKQVQKMPLQLCKKYSKKSVEFSDEYEKKNSNCLIERIKIKVVQPYSVWFI
jgi:hypothetical protein